MGVIASEEIMEKFNKCPHHPSDMAYCLIYEKNLERELDRIAFCKDCPCFKG